MPLFIMPLFWPLGHLVTLLLGNADEKPPKPTAPPILGTNANLTSFAAALRSFLIAYMLIEYFPGGYPAFKGRGATLDVSWIGHIVVRNLIGTWLCCGFWDWLLYFSPLKHKFHKHKFNPVYPSPSQIAHDAFVTTCASITAAAIEVLVCHGWACGALHAPDLSISDRPLMTAALALTITHWRIPHFWLIHRAMHPWRVEWMPVDVGKFLYRHVHSLHHKSYNPTAFSGTNMHPVESTLYYSACLCVVPLGAHPAVALGCIVDCAMGAWLGHDGFDWPGNGDYFHQLHHAHFDCNYGAQHVPMDYWLGTAIGDKSELKRVWKGASVGEGSAVAAIGWARGRPTSDKKRAGGPAAPAREARSRSPANRSASPARRSGGAAVDGAPSARSPSRSRRSPARAR